MLATNPDRMDRDEKQEVVPKSYDFYKNNQKQVHHMKNSQQKQQHHREVLAPNSPSSDTKTNIVDVLEFNSSQSQEQYDSEGGRYIPTNDAPLPMLQGSESGDLLKKLINNINNNYAVRNSDIRAQFNLQNIKCEEDLRPVNNLQNALAALFYTNYRMKDVASYFLLWRQLAAERQQQKEHAQEEVKQG